MPSIFPEEECGRKEFLSCHVFFSRMIFFVVVFRGHDSVGLVLLISCVANLFDAVSKLLCQIFADNLTLVVLLHGRTFLV